MQNSKEKTEGKGIVRMGRKQYFLQVNISASEIHSLSQKDLPPNGSITVITHIIMFPKATRVISPPPVYKGTY